MFVSIPSRGSGKGDRNQSALHVAAYPVSIPSRGSGKGDKLFNVNGNMEFMRKVSIPSRGSGKGDM
jgi:hypothetical protein